MSYFFFCTYGSTCVNKIGKRARFSYSQPNQCPFNLNSQMWTTKLHSINSTCHRWSLRIDIFKLLLDATFKFKYNDPWLCCFITSTDVIPNVLVNWFPDSWCAMGWRMLNIGNYKMTATFNGIMESTPYDNTFATFCECFVNHVEGPSTTTSHSPNYKIFPWYSNPPQSFNLWLIVLMPFLIFFIRASIWDLMKIYKMIPFS